MVKRTIRAMAIHGLRTLAVYLVLCSFTSPALAAKNDFSQSGLTRAINASVQIAVRSKEGISHGSGVILSTDGLVLCSRHSLEGAAKNSPVEVIIGKKRYAALVYEISAKHDIAFIQIAERNAPFVPAITAARSAGVGNSVFCIGYPRNDFQTDAMPTVTSGIVCALGRTLRANGTDYGPFTHVDAYANQGNSGGGIFDMDGKLIGMVVRVLTGSTHQWQATYAVPIETILKLMPVR